jgi:hypothetical protein
VQEHYLLGYPFDEVTENQICEVFARGNVIMRANHLINYLPLRVLPCNKYTEIHLSQPPKRRGVPKTVGKFRTALKDEDKATTMV